jgi:hypothetical protein
VEIARSALKARKSRAAGGRAGGGGRATRLDAAQAEVIRGRAEALQVGTWRTDRLRLLQQIGVDRSGHQLTSELPEPA